MTTSGLEEPDPVEQADVSAQLAEAVETLRAIRAGEVDALVLADGAPGEQVFTLSSADRPYRMFVENMRDGAATVSETGIVLYANRGLAELLSQPLSRIIGEPLTSLVAEAHHAALAAQNAQDAGGTIEIEMVGGDGRPIPVRVGAWTLDVDFERLVCLSFADLTQLKREQEHLTRASEKAVEASRLKSDFVANMSHEIRTPLNGVIGMSALLLETALTDEQREYADAVRASGDALLSVVDEILDFSKIEAGKLELETAPFTLLTMVEEVCSVVAGPAHAKGVELLSWVDGDLPSAVTGDRARVRQVLTNLLSNAVKFTAAGEVRVEVTDALGVGGGGICVEVIDTGIGVGPAALDRIFDSFAQADGSTTRRYGGTGLGLAISKHLVELMGGQIGVKSIEGEGSTFWFTLPVTPAAEGGSNAPVRTGLAGARVLAVDDNASSRDFLERQLLAWGTACDTAADGDAALDLLAAARTSGSRYDVVLLDAGMPGVGETELTDAVRAGSSGRRTPALMLISRHSEREAGRRARADGFVTKPVSQARLYDGMVGVLDLTRSDDQPGDEAATEPLDDGHQHAGSLVLLAEDNEINRRVAVRMLEQRGLRVDVATDGREALDRWRRRDYRAVFIDCQMPELDGYEVTAEIRRREDPDHRVPIIAMTANAMAGDREQCLAAGMDDYVGKPIDPGALDAAIGRSLAGAGGPARGTSPASGETRAVEPSPDSPAPLLDRSLLDELCRDDPKLHAELVEIFTTESQSGVADIGRATGAGDPEALQRAAHRLKGSSASVGALLMAEICEQLCQAGRAGLPSETPGLVDELERASELTRAAWQAAPARAALESAEAPSASRT